MDQGSVVSEVAERLMAHFTSGQVPPGTRLPSERQLSLSLGVGRSAVREALAALEILGVVIARPGSGTYLRGGVSELLPRTLSWGLMLGQPKTLELIELRGGLETQAAQLAATRATDEGLARMRTELETMEISLDNLEAFVAADAAFHGEIASASGSTVLNELLQSIRSLLSIWVDRALTDKQQATHTLEQHRQILRAIEARDAAAATDAMNSHMQTSARRLAVELNARQSRPHVTSTAT
jgi:GntR family transcriptional repressor for pyruvate dehydrogenase complex